jgi:hypothetical protein
VTRSHRQAKHNRSKQAFHHHSLFSGREPQTARSAVGRHARFNQRNVSRMRNATKFRICAIKPRCTIARRLPAMGLDLTERRAGVVRAAALNTCSGPACTGRPSAR